MNSVVYNVLLHWDRAFHTFVTLKTESTLLRESTMTTNKLYRHLRGVSLSMQVRTHPPRQNVILISRFSGLIYRGGLTLSVKWIGPSLT